jgi:pseudouridine-5'-phosphate glycosidase
MQQYLQFSQEVQQAMAEGRPVVALESTIISHGMPYPQNVQTAREVEQIIRDHGAVPATIAIMNGRIHIGLSDADLELLGQSRDAIKVSRRDLPYVLSEKTRRNHGCRHHDLRCAGEHSGVCDRWYRWCTPWRRNQL